MQNSVVTSKESPFKIVLPRTTKSPDRSDRQRHFSQNRSASPPGRSMLPSGFIDNELSKSRDENGLEMSAACLMKSNVPMSEMQKQIHYLQTNSINAIQTKEIQDFLITLGHTKNQINRIMWLDNECDSFKRDSRIEKLRNLGFLVEQAGSAEKLKVVLSNALIITTPTYIENIRRVADIEKNPNVIGIIILVENDFLRNYVHLSKYKKVVDVYSNFDEAFNYIIMAVCSTLT